MSFIGYIFTNILSFVFRMAAFALVGIYAARFLEKKMDNPVRGIVSFLLGWLAFLLANVIVAAIQGYSYRFGLGSLPIIGPFLGLFSNISYLFQITSYLFRWGLDVDFFFNIIYGVINVVLSVLTLAVQVFLLFYLTDWLKSAKKDRPVRANTAAAPRRVYHNDEKIVEEIRKYKKLLDAGAITQEEYDRKKAEFLK